MSRTCILHNNNAENLLTNCEKSSMNNLVIDFFMLNKFIDFSEFI